MCTFSPAKVFILKNLFPYIWNQTRQVSMRVFMTLILGSMCSINILDKISYYIAVVFFFITFKLAHLQIFK